jgi:hypothetical protein
MALFEMFWHHQHMPGAEGLVLKETDVDGERMNNSSCGQRLLRSMERGMRDRVGKHGVWCVI